VTFKQSREIYIILRETGVSLDSSRIMEISS